MENTMNNIPEMNIPSPTKKRLDKTGGIILVISLILSVVFFVIGFTSLGGGKKLELYQEKTDKVETYEYVTYEFTPVSGGYYVLYLDEATLSLCKDDKGYTLSYTTLSSYNFSSNYDNAYIIYIPRNTTCFFEVYTQSEEITLLVEDYNGY